MYGFLDLKRYDKPPLCFRYVQAGGTKSSYSFVVPLHDCGTAPSGGFGRTVDNVIVIQTDDTVQVRSFSVLIPWHGH